MGNSNVEAVNKSKIIDVEKINSKHLREDLMNEMLHNAIIKDGTRKVGENELLMIEAVNDEGNVFSSYIYTDAKLHSQDLKTIGVVK